MKSYLKKSLFVSVVFLVIFGCKSSKETVVSNEETQILQPKNLEPWYQDDDPSLKVGDPIIFYNEFKIKVKGKIPKTEKTLEDGSFVVDNSSITIDFPVEANTPGEVVYVEPGIDGPVALTIAFKKPGFMKEQPTETAPRELNEIEEFDDVEKDEISNQVQSEKPEDNPVNYYRTFKVLSDKTFTLDSRVEIIIDGKSWNANARIDGVHGGYCLLFVDKKNKNNRKTVGSPAPGVTPMKGKKVIKK